MLVKFQLSKTCMINSNYIPEPIINITELNIFYFLKCSIIALILLIPQEQSLYKYDNEIYI